MSELGAHNALALPKDPDYTDEVGNKWWGINKASVHGQRKYKCAYVEFPEGDANYVIMDATGVFYETTSLEQLLVRFALYRDGLLK